MTEEVIIGVVIFLICAVLTAIWRVVVKLKATERLKRRLRPGKPPKASSEKLVIFLSSGGTCRDPIAKAITLKLLKEKAPELNVRVEALALIRKSGEEATYGARHAISELYGEDLLADHVPREVEDSELEQAALVFVMDQHLLKSRKDWHGANPYLLKEFFGLKGDVKDPFRGFDHRDPETLARYLATAHEIKAVLEENSDLLLQALRD